jgi:FeS assembly SUF system protein
MLGLKKKNHILLALKDQIILALKGVFDPEIPVNIYDLGLIYDIQINPELEVHIQMTLTSPGCPVAQTFPGTVETAVNQVEGVNSTEVELIWEPPWTQERMSEAARLELGMFY